MGDWLHFVDDVVCLFVFLLVFGLGRQKPTSAHPGGG